MRRPKATTAVVAAILAALAAALAQAGSPSPRTALVSKTSGGAPANGDSGGFFGVQSAISASGRFVAFTSEAPNLPGADGVENVYVFDRNARRTTLVSKTSSGEPAANGYSEQPSISASGRFVAFTSLADNLPAGGEVLKVYVHDRRKKKTKLISKTSSGEPAMERNSQVPSVSASGRYIAFYSEAPNLPGDDAHGDVYVHDRKTKRTRLVSKTSGGEPANGSSFGPAISATARFVTFSSEAGNLPGGPSLGGLIYVRDLKAKRTRLASKTSSGEPADGFNEGPSISRSGRHVAFCSTASNLPGDDAYSDVYVHDRKTKRTRLVSKTSGGEPATGGNGCHYGAFISGSGRYVGFDSSATNLPGHPLLVDVFVHDRKTRRTRLVSVTSAGEPATGGDSSFGSIALSGRHVAFSSEATNLPGDPLYRDVYRRGPLR